MPSGYLKKIQKTIPFDGCEVAVEMDNLLFEDSLLFDAIASTPLEPPSEEVEAHKAWEAEVKPVRLQEINLYRKLLPKYVTKFEGLTAADGEALTFADVVNTLYFQPLVYALGTYLLVRSHPLSKLNERSQSDATAASDNSLSLTPSADSTSTPG